MDMNTLIGLGLISGILFVVSWLMVRNLKIINRIAKMNNPSLRDIKRLERSES